MCLEAISEGKTNMKKTFHLSMVHSWSSRLRGVPPSIKKDTKTCMRCRTRWTAGSFRSPHHISNCLPLLAYELTCLPGGRKSFADGSVWICALNFATLSKAAEVHLISHDKPPSRSGPYVHGGNHSLRTSSISVAFVSPTVLNFFSYVIST